MMPTFLLLAVVLPGVSFGLEIGPEISNVKLPIAKIIKIKNFNSKSSIIPECSRPEISLAAQWALTQMLL